MNCKELEAYCKAHNIFLPIKHGKNHRHVVDAAIVAASRHNQEYNKSNCFGCWEKDQGACLVCSLEEKCFFAKTGTVKEKYLARVELVENPRPTLSTMIKKKKKK